MRTGILQRVLSLSLLAFSFPLLEARQEPYATPLVRANEAGARLDLKEKNSIFSIELSTDAPRLVTATLTVKVVAPDDKLLAKASVPMRLSSAPRRAEVNVGWVPDSGLDDVSNSRVLYEVRLVGSSTPAASGILSPYALIPDLFELQFLGLNAISLGNTYVARVWATRPDSDKPVPGVSLNALIGDEGEETTPKGLKARARTNARGEAQLTFRLPEIAGAPDDEEVGLEIRGTRGNFHNSLTSTLHFWRRAAILLSTDKPLYQPDQTLHLRALILDDQHHAWGKQPVRFTLHDPDDSVVFSADVQSSRFGIASADWTIPSSQKLGNYRVSADIAGDRDNRDLQGNQLVRISRYELPTFSVNVVADKPFYLPGQNADLTVSGSYMFGKPVLRGHVRVVRETSRKWNYSEQKWETEEGQVQEGDLDAKNQFHATLDLFKDHADLRDSDWKRFEDLRYAAYLTDASSRRTQERHFDVRISRDAIHLYVLNVAGALPLGLRPMFYISSALANGTPAPADVEVKLYTKDPSDAGSPKLLAQPFATAQVRTNRYGIARVRFSQPLRMDKSTDENNAGDRIYLALEAKTADGRTGRHLESYSSQEEPALRITPARAILKPGDPIEAEVHSSVPQIRVGVDVIQTETQAILASQQLKLMHGSAHVIFPVNQQFSGRLLLATYPLDIEIDRYAMYSRTASASVIVPKPSNLQLKVKPVKTTYRPGEAATVNLHVLGPEGEPEEGALGLLVYDQAVEELARNEASLSTDNYERLDPRLGFRSLDEDSDSIAGVSLSQLLNRDPQAPVPADLEIAAEALTFNQGGAPLRMESSDGPRNLDQVFQKQIHSTLDPAAKLLQEHFTETGHFPTENAQYARFLAAKGIDASRLLDLWGRPYHVRRDYAWTNEVLEFRSEGPDKTKGTPDDFTALSLSRPFFEHDASRLRSVIDSYHARTGGYIRDQATLESACAQQNIPLSGFVDPWRTPYRFLFEIVRDNYAIKVVSAGPDKRFRTGPNDSTDDLDDLVVSVQNMPYFRETAQRISDALFESAKTSAHFPETEQEFRKVMADHGIDWDSLRDPWGKPYRVVPTVETGYSDRITLRAYGQNINTAQTPISRTMKAISIVSDGPDLTPNTADDVVLATFSSPFLEESGGTAGNSTTLQKPQPLYSGNSGAVQVIVQDQTGAVISNAKITLTNEATGIAYKGSSSEQGVCLLSNLPPGTYRLLAESPGFQSYVLTSIPVLSSNATEVEVTLRIGAVTETVEVQSERVMTLETSTSAMAVSAPKLGLTTKSGAASGQVIMPIATPRLREYFPETLLWQPEILTGRAGYAAVKVPLADSITTWKVSVIASTLDGHVAAASTDLRAFLPFFVELEPPKVLTVGDELHLPVTVRNYLDKAQDVSLDWTAEPWFEVLSQRTAHITVPGGDYAQETFSFRAARPMKEASQRLTGFNRSSANESDAIEKKLRIHADGQQRLVQASSVFVADTWLSVEIPKGALPGSVEAELVLYPNLIAHVSDAIEGIMERPYGCAEQTISSAYPSLLWLQLQKTHQLPSSPLDVRARHYLTLAYAKLLRYREPGGGFSLWGKGQPDIAVSAYALRFFTDASKVIALDPDVAAADRQWLLEQAAPQGGWTEKDYNGKRVEDSGPYLTAYVVEALARDLEHRTSDDNDIETERQAVRSGIAHLSKTARATSDPYDIALIALAKLAARDDASQEIRALLSLEHAEGETSYWDLYHNTIFYGWGYTGRIETTALVLDALAIAKQQGLSSAELDRALDRGTLFLLKNKDDYGIWYSTQATVDVLETLVRQLDGGSPDASRAPMRIVVDGKPGPALSMSSDARQLTPQRADLTQFFSPGRHTIEVRGGGSAHASAYVNASYYVPWTDRAVTGSSVLSGDAESLRYSVKFDHSAVNIGDLVHCTVHAERVGFRGYGMMLAEVGLPPGAEVDRASIDSAVSTSGWDLQSYEVQPDRVVFYLWPRAGGTTFSFAFKPRFAMAAQSSESILYDYYNPEARASVAPTRFTVK